jgi:FkbM family methyltransferase
MLSTQTKIALAATASTLVLGTRRLLGRGPAARVRRGGHQWALDLREGIDFSIYLLGAFEPGTSAALRRLIRPGDVAFDIGANVGAHTLGMAASVGPTGTVVAIEPTDEAFGKLTRNVALNPDLAPRVRLRQHLMAATAETPAPAALYSSWPLRPTGPVHAHHGGRLVTTAGASVTTLDDLMAREGLTRLDLIKMDVDGFEARVLAGGAATLRHAEPILVMELAPYVHAEAGGSFSELVDLLGAAGYQAIEAGSGRPVAWDVAQLERRIPAGASLNIIATGPRRARA